MASCLMYPAAGRIAVHVAEIVEDKDKPLVDRACGDEVKAGLDGVYSPRLNLPLEPARLREDDGIREEYGESEERFIARFQLLAGNESVHGLVHCKFGPVLFTCKF